MNITQEFFSGSAHNIKTDIVRKWLKQLTECRSSGKQFQLPSDSNLNTMLKHILYDDQGTFLYNFPSSELRSKSNRLISNKNKSDNTTSSPSIDTTQLQEFFSGSAHNIKTDIVRKWLKQLTECRSSGKQFQLPSDSNLNTMLKHILYDDQGTFLYNFPSSELRSKSNRLISNKNKSDNTTSSPSIDTTQLLTNLVKGMKHHQN
ncbi:unnamed protein product [Adineta steineri]|uniref:Uncharacterized protein n=1 Tax=Adineta steineri TaxID=433720 RepID=A0A815JG26_9BILA|nr:unnamed protein product [Adineta steineri]